MKRHNAQGQLRREEVEALEDADEEAEAGTFKRASEEVIAKRKIYKVNRSFGGKDTSTVLPQGSLGLSDGSGNALKESTIPKATEMTKAPAVSTSNESIYQTKMRKLNATFVEWLQTQNKDNSASIWADGLNDYINYCDEISAKYPPSKPEVSESIKAPEKVSEKSIAPTTSSNLFAKVNLAPTSTPASTGSTPFSGFAGLTTTKSTTVSFGATTSIPSSTPSTVTAVEGKKSTDISTTATSTASASTATAVTSSSNPFAGFTGFSATNTTSTTTLPATTTTTTTATLPATTTATTTTTTAKTSASLSATTPFAGFKGFDAGAATGISSTTTTTTALPQFTGFGSTKPTDNTTKATPTIPTFTGFTGFSNPLTKSADTTTTPATSSLPSIPAFTGFAGFGATPATTISTTSTSTSSNIFGKSTTLPSFGQVSAPTGGKSVGNGEGGGEEEDGDNEDEADEDGEKQTDAIVILKNTEDTDIILYEVTCKLYRYNSEEKEWGDLGKGTLRVTRAPDTQKQRILIRNTTGRPLVNAYFYKGMKFDTVKNSIKFAAFVSDENGSKLRNFNVKVNPTNIDETMKFLNEGVKSCS